MSLLTRPVEELLRYILTRIHGGLLLGELDHNHFQAKVTDGIYILSDLNLNPHSINQNLAESIVHISKARISSIHINFPSIINIMGGPISVQVREVLVELCSAGDSGFSVIKNIPSIAPTECEEEQGVTLMTKAIGNLLSNIIFEISVIKIRIRAKPEDPDYVQFMIPKMTLTDINKEGPISIQKLLKIGGIRISVMKGEREIYDPSDYSNICVLENEIEAKIIISKELLFVDCIMEAINVLMSPEQMRIVLNILTNLRKSDLIEHAGKSFLEEAYEEFEEEIKESAQSPIMSHNQEKTVKFQLKSLVVGLLCDETIPFRKKWEYSDGPYPALPESHFLLKIAGIKFVASHNMSLRIKDGFLKYFHLANTQALESSSIYQSARQSFFPDFFMGKNPNSGFWAVDINTQHFCTKNIIYFHKSARDIPMSPGVILKQTKEDIELKISRNDIFAKLAMIHINLDSITIFRLKQLQSLFENRHENHSQSSKTLVVEIPMIFCEYQHNELSGSINEMCCCNEKYWKITTELKLVKIVKKEKLEINLAEADINIVKENELLNIARIYHIKFDRQLQEENHEEVLEEHKENPSMRYYIPGQGTAVITKNVKTSEPYSSISEDSFVFEPLSRSMLQEDLWKGRANYTNSIVSTSIEIFIDSNSLLLLIPLLPIGNKSKHSYDKKESWNIQIREIALNLCSNNAHVNWNYPQPNSMQSCYTLDASVTKTVDAVIGCRIPTVAIKFKEIEIFLLKNCVSGKEIYFSTEVKSLDGYYGDSNLIYSIDKNPVLFTFEKDQENDFNIMLQNILICADNFVHLFEFIKEFEIKIPKNDNKLTKLHLLFKNLYISYNIKEARAFLYVEDLALWSMLGSPSSIGLHSKLGSLRLYLQCPVPLRINHPILSSQLNPIQLDRFLQSQKFVLSLSMDSIDFFMTIIHKDKHSHPSDDSDQCPPFLECLIGSDQCTSISNKIFISEEVRNCILNEELLEIHANFGCIIFHLCKDTISVLSKFINLPADEEPIEMMRKDSDLSSDDSDTYPVQITGLTINPNRPDELKNINLQDYLSPEFRSKEEAKVHKKPIKKSIRKSQIIHTHTEIPSIVKSNTVESDFHQLKQTHGFPTIRASMCVFYLCINIYSGNDFTGKSRHSSLRNPHSSIQIKSENLGLTFSKFPKKLHYSWRLALTAEEFEILDLIRNSAVNKLLQFDSTKIREKNSHLFQLEVSAVWPRPTYSSDIEFIISSKLLPLKVNIDQHFVEFCLDLANWKPEEQVSMRKTATVPGQVIPQPSQSPKKLYIQKMIIEKIEINLDYIPHSIGGRHPGANILNIFQIEGFNLMLPKIEIKGSRDLQQALLKAWKFWFKHIRDKELVKLISGLGPMTTLTNLGTALYDVISLPYNSDSAVDGTKQALVGLVKTFSIESIKLVETFMSGAYTILQGFGNAAGIKMPSKQALVRPLQNIQTAVRNILGW